MLISREHVLRCLKIKFRKSNREECGDGEEDGLDCLGKAEGVRIDGMCMNFKPYFWHRLVGGHLLHPSAF